MKLATKLSVALLLSLVSPLAFAASIGIDGLVTILIYLVVLGLIFYLIWWFVGYVGLPEPFGKVARVLIGLVAFILLLYLLLALLPPLPGSFR